MADARPGSAGRKAEGMAAGISGKYAPPSKEHPAMLRDRLRKEGGPGRPADPVVKDRLASAVGAGIEQTRLHTGPAAAQAAQGLKASAFTIGRDVFFGAGKYDPHSPQGMGLIAHEATHVGQQTLGDPAKARFHTRRGGDEMEQEAQQTAELVMRNLGARESFSVGEYVRRYESEDEKGIAPIDGQRLDRLSLLALTKAQKDVRLRRLPRQSAISELNVDLTVELGDRSDEEIVEAWSEAIVTAVLRTQRTVAPEMARVQRDPVSNVSLPPAPASSVTVRVHIAISDPDLRGYGGAEVMMSPDRDAVFQGLRAVGMTNMPLLSVILGRVKGFKDAGKDIADKGATPVAPFEVSNPDPQNTAFDESYAMALRPFLDHTRSFEAEWTGFQADFIRRGSLAVLQLIGEGRKRTEKLIADLGIETYEVADALVTTRRHSSKSDRMAKLSVRAGAVAEKQKALDDLLEKRKSNEGFFHQLFTSQEDWDREDKELLAKIPPAREAYNQERVAAQAEFPILTHFDTTAKLKALSDGSTVAQEVGEKLFEVLESIGDIDSRISGSNERILELTDYLGSLKRTLGLSTFEGATVDYMREKRTGDIEAGQRTLQLFAMVVGAIAAAPTAGGSLLAASAAVAEAGISTAMLLHELDQYTLQKAAAQSDPDLAQALAKEEPSFFWMALSVVQTLSGLKDNVGQISKTFNEIKAAYKVAQITQDADAFAAVLKAKGVPEKERPNFLKRLLEESMAITDTLAQQGPKGLASAWEMIKNSNSFYEVRLAIWKLRAPTEPIIKGNLQAARLKAIGEIVEKAKVKMPLYNYTLVDGGFEKPVVIKIERVGPVPDSGPATLRGFPPPPGNSPGGGGGSGGPSGTLPGIGPGLSADITQKADSAAFAPTVKALPDGQLLASPGQPPLGPAPKAVSPIAGSVPPAGGASPVAGSVPVANGAVSPIAGSVPGGGAPVPFGTQMSAANDPVGNLERVIIDQGGEAGLKTYDLVLEGNTVVPMGTLSPELREVNAIMGTDPNHYQGMFFRIDTERFKVEPALTSKFTNPDPNANVGSSGKMILFDATSSDAANPALFMFKPAGQEALLHPMYQAEAGTYFARGAAANMVAKELPTIHAEIVPQTVVSWGGKLGSLQPFKKGTRNLLDIHASSPQLFDKVTHDPKFVRMEQNIQAFDHVINNADRNLGNYMVELDANDNLVHCYAIDPDLGMNAGGRTLTLNPAMQHVPNMSTMAHDLDVSKLGKISRSLYDEFLMMKANEASIRETMIAVQHVSPAQVDGVFFRLDEVLRDYGQRLKTLPIGDVFSD